MGHLNYLFFYILSGVVAVFSQYLFNLGSNIPMIGASGAVSGVAGAYFLLYPRGKIKALVPLFFGLYDIVILSAWFFLGYWFLIQLLSGFGSLVTFDINQGGVAWFAHIGGFLFGYFWAKRFKKGA